MDEWVGVGVRMHVCMYIYKYACMCTCKYVWCTYKHIHMDGGQSTKLEKYKEINN